MKEVYAEMVTWSYTILGSDEAYRLLNLYCDISESFLTEGEVKNYYTSTTPFVSDVELMNRSYNELINAAHKQNTRLAFQVLGLMVMSSGAKMTDDLKRLILKNSQWKDDRRQFTLKVDRKERKKYLIDFRAKILQYKEGQELKVPFENPHKVIERTKARGDLPLNYNYQLVQCQPLI